VDGGRKAWAWRASGQASYGKWNDRWAGVNININTQVTSAKRSVTWRWQQNIWQHNLFIVLWHGGISSPRTQHHLLSQKLCALAALLKAPHRCANAIIMASACLRTLCSTASYICVTTMPYLCSSTQHSLLRHENRWQTKCVGSVGRNKQNHMVEQVGWNSMRIL